MIIIIFLMTGIFVGLISGLLGVGGGLTIVPVLYYTFIKCYHLDGKVAITIALDTSLAIVIPTLLSSVISHHRSDNIIWKIVLIMAPSLSIGALCASLFLPEFLPEKTIKTIFSIFCMVISLKMFFQIKREIHKGKQPSKISLITMGLVIGGVSSILGIVGGSLSASYLSRYDIPMKNIIASTAAIGLPIAIFGCLGFILIDLNHATHLSLKWSLGYIYFPAVFFICLTSTITAPIGVALTNRISNLTLKKIFATLLFLISLKML